MGYNNCALKTIEEVKEAAQKLQSLRLKPHPDFNKCWDGYKMIEFILKYSEKDNNILDIGCRWCPILLWLKELKFSNLYGCDTELAPKDIESLRVQGINASGQNLMYTNYPLGFFDMITSLSVIEHGVDLNAYFAEMGRILKHGGYLLTSADYWETPIDTKGIYPYGKKYGEMKVFTELELSSILDGISNYGFQLIEPLDFSVKDKVVEWKRVDRKYTFIFFILRKI